MVEGELNKYGVMNEIPQHNHYFLLKPIDLEVGELLVNKTKHYYFLSSFHQIVGMAVGIVLLLPISLFAGQGDVTVSGTVTARAFITEKVPTIVEGNLSYQTDIATESGAIYEVPPGQRYVIELVSVWSTPSNCAFYLMPILDVTTSKNSADFFLPSPERTYSSKMGTYRHHGTWLIKFYADSESSIGIGGIRSAVGCSVDVRFKLSGYLEYQEPQRVQ